MSDAPVRRTAFEVADFLVNHLTGAEMPHAWDEFTSVPIADPRLEEIRLRCVQLEASGLMFVSPNWKARCGCYNICSTFTTFSYAAGANIRQLANNISATMKAAVYAKDKSEKVLELKDLEQPVRRRTKSSCGFAPPPSTRWTGA
jgi:hypothetical protein